MWWTVAHKFVHSFCLPTPMPVQCALYCFVHNDNSEIPLIWESQFTCLQLLKDNCCFACSAVPYNNVAVSAESSERDGDEASVSSTTPTSPRTRSSVRVLRTNMFSRAHAFQTFLHLVSLTLSYFLMLIAMTFNSWLFGSVVGGLAAG